MADKQKKKDAHAATREALMEEHDKALAAAQEAHERALALLSVPQKVVDGNEAAALETITGWAPHRDTSDAPAPAVLGAPAAEDDPSQ